MAAMLPGSGGFDADAPALVTCTNVISPIMMITAHTTMNPRRAGVRAAGSEVRVLLLIAWLLGSPS